MSGEQPPPFEHIYRWPEVLPRDWSPGEVDRLAAVLEERDRDVEDFLSRISTPTEYATTWACSSGTNPSLGNGTLYSEWTRFGTRGEVSIHLKAGSTTTFGSGLWTFSLPDGWTPFTSVAISDAGDNNNVGVGWAYDNSAGAPYAVAAYVFNGSSKIFVVQTGAYVYNAVPFSWGTSDQLHLTVPVRLA